MESQPVKWTIMAYINADNILANFAVESLKQLRNAASENVTVIAEFADNQPNQDQQRNGRLYLFDGSKKSDPLDASLIPAEDVSSVQLQNIDMTQPGTLTQFIDFATSKSPAQHYCLILWGHGIELLMDDDRRFAEPPESDAEGSTSAAPNSDGKPASRKLEVDEQPAARYLTIANLKSGLSQTRLATAKPSMNTLDIIGFDACSMSMIEVASAIQKYARYMIASQEDVPDMSFPYEKILNELKGKDVKEVCGQVPTLYREAYSDYIASPGTGVKGITLASLDLDQTGNIAGPLQRLSQALLQASRFDEKRKAIFAARKKSKDFVFGILADLGDFCEKLQAEFKKINDPTVPGLCKLVQDALEPGEGEFLLENQVTSNDTQCRGISFYFPYRNENDATENMDEHLSKGTGNRPLKGTGNRPLKGTANRPLKERAARIRELEADLSQRDEAGIKEWMNFIRQGWSSILAEKVGFELDYYYSAEQCAVNLVGQRAEADAKAAA